MLKVQEYLREQVFIPKDLIQKTSNAYRYTGNVGWKDTVLLSATQLLQTSANFLEPQSLAHTIFRQYTMAKVYRSMSPSLHYRRT